MRCVVEIASESVSPTSAGLATVFAEGAKKSRIACPNQTLTPTKSASATAKSQSWRTIQGRRRDVPTGAATSPVNEPRTRGSRERFELREIEFGVGEHAHDVFVLL